MAKVKSLTVNNIKYEIKDQNAIHADGGTIASGNLLIKGTSLLLEKASDNTYRAYLFKNNGNTGTFEVGLMDRTNENGINGIVFNPDGTILVWGQGIDLTNLPVNVPTVDKNDVSQKAVNTSFISQKFVYSETEPSNKQDGVFYFVKE